jgi:hypothetical protein
LLRYLLCHTSLASRNYRQCSGAEKLLTILQTY